LTVFPTVPVAASPDLLGAGRKALKPLNMPPPPVRGLLAGLSCSSNTLSARSDVAIGKFTLILRGLELSTTFWNEDLVCFDACCICVAEDPSSSEPSESE
jgi:hypothetical protein